MTATRLPAYWQSNKYILTTSQKYFHHAEILKKMNQTQMKYKLSHSEKQ